MNNRYRGGRKPSIAIAPEMLQSMFEMLKAGRTLRAIIAETGVSGATARRKLRPLIEAYEKAGGVLARSKGGRPVKVSPELHQRLAERLEAGASIRQMARETGIGPFAIRASLGDEVSQMIAEGRFNLRITQEQKERREEIIAAIVAGKSFGDIAAQWRISPSAAYAYQRHMTPQQLRQRKALTERRVFRPHRDDLYARINAAVPHWMSEQLRDDIISDLYLAVLEADVSVGDIEQAARKFSAEAFAAFESRFGPRSLDELAFEDGRETLGDRIADPSALAAFDYIFGEAAHG